MRDITSGKHFFLVAPLSLHPFDWAFRRLTRNHKVIRESCPDIPRSRAL